jgi:anti-sigma B factor antagonist
MPSCPRPRTRRQPALGREGVKLAAMSAAAFEAEGLDEYIQLIVVEGELDLSSSAELRRRVEAALKEGRNSVVLDLTEVTHMDSTGLASLIAAHQLTSQRRGRLALVITSEAVRRTVEVRGLDRLFTIARTRDEGLAAVRDESA